MLVDQKDRAALPTTAIKKDNPDMPSVRRRRHRRSRRSTGTRVQLSSIQLVNWQPHNPVTRQDPVKVINEVCSGRTRPSRVQTRRVSHSARDTRWNCMSHPSEEGIQIAAAGKLQLHAANPPPKGWDCMVRRGIACIVGRDVTLGTV